MPDRPEPRPGILEIAPYVPGRSVSGAGKRTIKLSSNESPLGASEAAIRAYREAADGLAVYPDGAATHLREAIGKAQGLNPDKLAAGAGSDELLHLLAQVFIGPGDNAVVSEFGFLVYPIVTRAAGGDVVVAKERDLTADVEAILAAVTERTRVVFLANPNNPTGTYISAARLDRLHAGLRSDILLVVDSAYAEYVTAEDYDAGIDLVDRSDNVVMVRTFSKIGLAALRVGWLYGPERIVDAVNRVRGPFNVSAPAQAAAAAAAADTEFISRLHAHNSRWRDWLSAHLNTNRMTVVPSQANFVLVRFGDEPGNTAADANAALLEAGVVAREMSAYGLPDALRITIGTQQAMEKVAEVLNGLGSHE